MKRRVLTTIAVLVVLSVAAIAVLNLLETEKENRKPNVIFISVDTLRQDHLGVYGYHRNTSPNFDKLANRGVRFNYAFSSAPWTLPAHMSMLTGLPPSIHSVENKKDTLDKSIQTVADVFRQNNYKTAGIITLPFVSSKYGFSKGFETFTQLFKERAGTVTDKAIQWLQGNKDQNCFLFLHYCDVHWPYFPPPKYAQMFDVDTAGDEWKYYGKLSFLRKYGDPAVPMPEEVKKTVIGLYDGEIRSFDFHLQRLIDFLEKEDLAEDTILVITSDHGEEFKEHDSFGHSHSFYSEVIKVPLIIYFPRHIKGGGKINEPVGTADLPLTLMRMAGIKAPPQFLKYGVDLQVYWKRGEEFRRTGLNRRFIVESAYSCPKHFAIIKQGYKYIAPFKFHPSKQAERWIPIPESLFSIYNDPGDAANLLPLPDSPRERNHLEELLNDLQVSLRRFVREHVKGVKLVFSAPKKAGEPVHYTGYVKYEHTWLNPPFGVNFTGADSLEPTARDGRFHFDIRVSGISKTIYLPLFDPTKPICVGILEKGEIVVEKELTPPPRSKSILLVPAGERGAKISLKGSVSATVKEQLTLTDKEKKMLESLGYI